MAEYTCTRCRLREPGMHDCDDLACWCCSGETYRLDDPGVLTAEILASPRAMAEIREAQAEIERGEGLRGADLAEWLAEMRRELAGPPDSHPPQDNLWKARPGAGLDPEQRARLAERRSRRIAEGRWRGR